IDDFRDSGLERERASSDRDSSRGRATDWQARTSIRLKLQKVREAESSSDHAIAQNREHSHDSPPAVSREGRQAALLKEHNRHYANRDRTYSLRPSEIRALTEVGKFRVVGVDDLASLAYNGDRERMQSDLRNLA